MDKKLNNLLSFEDFGKRAYRKAKPTKRTDVGLDVINEHFFDRLVHKIKQGDVPAEMLDEIKKRIRTAASSGQIKDLEKSGSAFTFTINKRTFKIDPAKGKITINLHKTEWDVEAKVKKDVAPEVIDLPKASIEELTSRLEEILTSGKPEGSRKGEVKKSKK